MKTKSTSLFIAVAAFAVTASGVHAFSNPDLLIKAGLTDEQVIAVQEAQELKATGNVAAARETLAAAGITDETMQLIRQAAKEAKEVVRQAITAGDYQAFKVAIVDSPLEDLIETEADFRQFVAAHELRQNGGKAAAAELGIDRPIHKVGAPNRHGHCGAQIKDQLTDQQREALQVAHAANDKEAVRAIFAEAGINLPDKTKRVKAQLAQ